MANANRTPNHDPTQERMLCFGLARDCQAFHMQGNGWSDTGQHLTIWRSGRCTEGRHGSVAAILNGQSVWGAHCADPDTNVNRNDAIGIELEGTYGAVNGKLGYVQGAPTPAQVEMLIEVLAWICTCCKLDTALITDHRRTGCLTACPGDTLDSMLPTIIKKAHDMKVALSLTGKKPTPKDPNAPPAKP
jgi:hypothetical protein